MKSCSRSWAMPLAGATAYFGGSFLPAALVEKWCPALYFDGASRVGMLCTVTSEENLVESCRSPLWDQLLTRGTRGMNVLPVHAAPTSVVLPERWSSSGVGKPAQMSKTSKPCLNFLSRRLMLQKSHLQRFPGENEEIDP